MRHLDLLNAFLALRFRQPGYPAFLEDLGYLVQSIGVSFKLPDGKTVAPDVITSQPERRVTLLVEVKSGGQIKLDQLRRMLAVTPEYLRDYAYLPVPEPDEHRVQVVYVCNEEHREELDAQISGVGPVVLLSFDGARFRVSGVALLDADLGASLADAEVAPGSPPLAIVPFDDESPDEEVARALLPHVVDAWVRGSGTVRPTELVSRTHHLVHDAMVPTGSRSELAGVEKRARQVLDALAKAELADLLEHVSSSPHAWRFRRGLPRDGTRTRELQKLQRAAEKYLESVGSRRAVQLWLPEIDSEGSTDVTVPL